MHMQNHSHLHTHSHTASEAANEILQERRANHLGTHVQTADAHRDVGASYTQTIWAPIGDGSWSQLCSSPETTHNYRQLITSQSVFVLSRHLANVMFRETDFTQLSF